jgi:archaellum biogenesis ATPase FlaH
VASAPAFRRVVAISLRPPTFSAPPGTELTYLPIQVGGDPDSSSSPTKLSGRIRSAAESDGGALVYFDAFETLATEVGIEPMLKFVTWLVQLAESTGSAVVVSVDPSTLDPRSMSLLQRAFPHVD